MPRAAALAHAEAPLQRPPRSHPARRRVDLLPSGVAWIAVLAVLLGGVVALNVAVLQVNVRMDQLSRERASIRADNARLASRLSTAAAATRIEMLARRRLGLVPARPETTTYIDLGGP